MMLVNQWCKSGGVCLQSLILGAELAKPNKHNHIGLRSSATTYVLISHNIL